MEWLRPVGIMPTGSHDSSSIMKDTREGQHSCRHPTTALTGGSGSVGATLTGALLLAMVFNILNFENGLGWISLSAYWQSVIRGLFLLVILQTRLAKKNLA